MEDLTKQICTENFHNLKYQKNMLLVLVFFFFNRSSELCDGVMFASSLRYRRAKPEMVANLLTYPSEVSSMGRFFFFFFYETRWAQQKRQQIKEEKWGETKRQMNEGI